MAHSSEFFCELPVHIFLSIFYFLLLFCLTFFFCSRVYILYSEALYILQSFHIEYLIFCHLKSSLMQLTTSTFFFFLILFNFILFFFFTTLYSRQNLNSLTKTHIPCIGSTESKPLDPQEIPLFSFKVLLFYLDEESSLTLISWYFLFSSKFFQCFIFILSYLIYLNFIL